MRLRKQLVLIAAILLAVLMNQTPAAAQNAQQKIGPSRPALGKARTLGRLNMATQVHWYMGICSSAAVSVTLQAGPSSDDNVVFATWHPGDGQKRFALPDRVQSLDSVFVQITLPDGKWQTEACVGYDGYAKQAFHMDHGNENHQISKGDSDDGCACR
jgi:hypothetical protein